MTAADKWPAAKVREQFTSFFEAKEHKMVPSSQQALNPRLHACFFVVGSSQIPSPC